MVCLRSFPVKNGGFGGNIIQTLAIRLAAHLNGPPLSSARAPGIVSRSCHVPNCAFDLSVRWPAWVPMRMGTDASLRLRFLWTPALDGLHRFSFRISELFIFHFVTIHQLGPQLLAASTLCLFDLRMQLSASSFLLSHGAVCFVFSSALRWNRTTDDRQDFLYPHDNASPLLPSAPCSNNVHFLAMINMFAELWIWLAKVQSNFDTTGC